MIKNIIFDFDGVIVDSEVLASKAFAKYFNTLGYSFQDDEFYSYAGMKTIEVIDNLSKKFKIENKNKFTYDVFEIVSKIYLTDLRLVFGAEKYIRNSKKKHFIGSNSNKDRIISGLKIVGLSKEFPKNKIYSFDMVQNPKPHPDIYLKVLEDNNLNEVETIVLEDSGVGVKAAKLANLRVFGLTAGKHWNSNRDKNELYDNGAINVFSSYKDLEKALEGL
tara:strand:+ start:36 stop:695 length:660 start_codon:yes stop_codon:yes gene_type:complete